MVLAERLRITDDGVQFDGKEKYVKDSRLADVDPLAQSFMGQQNKSEVSEVLKELFDEGKIYLIGDLSTDEIKIATRIYMIAKIKKIDVWLEGLEFWCKLKLSHKRKSRKELIDAIVGYNSQKLNMMNPMNWGKPRQ